MANVIEQAAQAIRARLAQLEELLAEQEQLKKALDALEGVTGVGRGRAGAPGARGESPAGRGKRAPTGASRGARSARRRGGPSRAEQFVALVAERPGITVAEAAERLGTSRNTLYNLTARLQREGRLRKDGRGFYPADEQTPQQPSAGPSTSAS
jgi:transposase-like protein